MPSKHCKKESKKHAKKHSKKQHKTSSRSRSSSRSSSSSETVVYTNVVHRKKEKKNSKKSSKSSSKSSSSSSRSKSKTSKKSNSSKKSTESEHKKFCFDEIYDCYKWKLLQDPKLMVGGSDAYVNVYNTIVDVIPTEYPHEMNNTSLIYGVDRPAGTVPYYVRESGVYMLMTVINSDQASQFSFSINGIQQQLSRVGNNSGAGQLLLESLIKLKKHDGVVVRNDNSGQPITSKLFNGGTNSGTNANFLLVKLAPYESAEKCCDWDDKCLSKKKLYLFKKLMDKLLVDPELMVQGFNNHGSFYTKLTQTIALEADYLWDNYQNVNGFIWNPSGSNAAEIKVLNDGVYKIAFLANTSTPAQACITVNGVPLDYTIAGINKGAAEFSIRAILLLNANDVITIRNHSSSVGSTVITALSGGTDPSNSAILTIFKVAPIVKPTMPLCKLNKYYDELFEKFRCYLLNKDCLDLDGVSAYSLTNSNSKQILNIDDKVDWSTTNIQLKVKHDQGYPTFTILEDGVYIVHCDMIFDQPAQICLYINGVEEMSAIAGRDSGGGKILLNQILALKVGDELEIRNDASYAGTLTTTINAGGIEVGLNAQFLLLKLSPPDGVPCPPTKCEVKKCSKKGSKKGSKRGSKRDKKDKKDKK